MTATCWRWWLCVAAAMMASCNSKGLADDEIRVLLEDEDSEGKIVYSEGEESNGNTDEKTEKDAKS